MRTSCVLAVFVLAVLTLGVLADTITGEIKLSAAITHTGSATASSLTETISDPWKWGASTAFMGTNGSPTGLSRIYVSSTTIAGSGTNTIDLYSSTLDSFGSPLAFSAVKFIWFAPSNTTSSSMTILPASSAGFTNWTESTTGNKIRSGGLLAIMAPDAGGYAVSNGACDSISIINGSTNSGSYVLFVGGI